MRNLILFVMAELFVAAPAFAQTAPAANLDGTYVGPRVGGSSATLCRDTARRPVTLIVNAGVIHSQPPPPSETAPVDDSGNFTLSYDTIGNRAGPVTITYAGQIAGDTAKGTLDITSPQFGTCHFTFSAKRQAPKN